MALVPTLSSWGMGCPAPLLIKWGTGGGAREAGRRLTVKPARDGQISFPRIFVGTNGADIEEQDLETQGHERG